MKVPARWWHQLHFGTQTHVTQVNFIGSNWYNVPLARSLHPLYIVFLPSPFFLHLYFWYLWIWHFWPPVIVKRHWPALISHCICIHVHICTCLCTCIHVSNRIFDPSDQHVPLASSFLPSRWIRNSSHHHPIHPFVSLPWGFGPRYNVWKYQNTKYQKPKYQVQNNKYQITNTTIQSTLLCLSRGDLN